MAGRRRELAAAEVRTNAARGFKAVSFPEFPAQLGLPSIFSGEWDPFFAACEETETVVCLHTGASSWAPLPSPDPPFELLPTLFPVNALLAAGEWLWSGVPLRFPRLQVAMSEGGIGWVPMLMDRADYVLSHSASGTESTAWPSTCCPARCCGATSGSAPLTTPPPCRSATSSGSTTSWWRATTPTPTPRGPTPRPC